MCVTPQDLRQFKGRNIWWMSFPHIESRPLIVQPFGAPPRYNIGDVVRFKEKPKRLRKVLKIEWHSHRYQWVYIVETSASDGGRYFEPYWFEEKLELCKNHIETVHLHCHVEQ